MSDFEVHPIGTTREIQLSRALATQIEQVMQQYGAGILPHNVTQAYNKLYEYYLKQIEMENT